MSTEGAPKEPLAQNADSGADRGRRISRRKFLRAAGKVAIGAIAASTGRSQRSETTRPESLGEKLLTKEALQSAILKLQQEDPQMWKTIMHNKIEMSVGQVAFEYRRNSENKKLQAHGKIGAGVGLAGLDLLYTIGGLQGNSSDLKHLDPSHRFAKLREQLEHPIKNIIREIRSFGETHAIRSGVATASGGLTAFISSMLTTEAPDDQNMRADAIMIAEQTLVPESPQSSPEIEQFRKDISEYILKITHEFQPWLAQNAIRDPIKMWGAGSYLATRSIAASNEQEGQEPNTP